jgi:hypothetical protein
MILLRLAILCLLVSKMKKIGFVYLFVRAQKLVKNKLITEECVMKNLKIHMHFVKKNEDSIEN